MQALTFEEIVDHIVKHDSRYTREAYQFVREALDYTQRQVHQGKRPRGPLDNRHVTGQQLLDGLRDLALQSFGPMALFSLHQWGLRRCEDVGEVVFNLVEFGHGMFGKTDQDRREDFQGGYDFTETFRRPFEPTRRPAATLRPLREA